MAPEASRDRGSCASLRVQGDGALRKPKKRRYLGAYGPTGPLWVHEKRLSRPSEDKEAKPPCLPGQKARYAATPSATSLNAGI